MREIKFRAQDFTKTWKYGYVAMGNDSAVLFPKMKDGSVMTDIQIYVLPETIGQFTGLNDNHGHEIYEGDILKVPGNECYADIIGVVEFSKGRFVVRSTHGTESDLAWCVRDRMFGQPKSEIIGNIIDNPELLAL